MQFVLASSTTMLIASCGSSDSDSSSRLRPLTPVTATISARATELFENSRDGEEVWVDITPSVNRSVWVQFAFEGTATEGLDFAIDDPLLTFRPNQTRASTTLRPLNDWLPEETETLTLSLGNLSTATSVGVPGSVAFTIADDGDQELTPAQKVSRAELFLYTDASFSAATAKLEVNVWNFGNMTSSETFMAVSLHRLIRPGELGRAVEEFQRIEVPPLGSGERFRTSFDFSLAALSHGRTYWSYAEIDRVPEEGDYNVLPNREYNGFTLDSRGRILVGCEEPNRPVGETETDPLFEHQWSLQNSGQKAFAAHGGTAGEDLQMQSAIEASQPTGRGVNVAVVDTGLEICHPDLAANVERNESYNFRADLRRESDGWFNAELTDPYLPDSRGDHGTSVAGVIGAKGNNGMGLRGVAPDVRLFGFNYLSENCCREDALGASNREPNSAQIDVFNMSFGTFGFQYSYPDDTVVRYGTRQLRAGLGAIYVKAAGNSFGRCVSFRHVIHDLIGCSSSNGDPFNNVPHLIVVGALNAHGAKASYSSVGSNLWISAPAGEYGVNEPASITTDQFGRYRGYSSRNWPGIAENQDADPYGDYGSNFNGTSAAAPHTAGAVALLLEEEPGLTWRDVKHVLASTARRSNSSRNPDQSQDVMIGNRLATFQRHWITNGAGYMFHNHFGFGALDVDAALNFIRGDFRPDNLGEQQLSEWISYAGDVLNIPDHDGGGLESSLNVDLPARANIEAAQLWVNGTHDNLSDLSIELTSPSGTRSILNQVFNNAIAGDTQLDWQLLSNAFYGESPRGLWRIKIIDAAVGDTGSLDSWAIRFWHGEHP